MAEMLSPYASMYPPGLAPGGLPEEDEESLKNRLLGMGGSALGWLGGVLNKPGRAVRGAIGALEGIPGAASEMLNIIPYSDAFGITDPAQEVTGRKMLGLGPRQAQAGFFANLPEDILGFGAEVLTDPLTHISAFGRALGKGGQIAAAAGALPKGALAKTAEEAAMLGVKPGEYAGGMLRRMAGTLRPIYEGAEPELRSAIERAAESRGGLTAATMDKPLGGLLGVGPFAGFTDPMTAIGTGPMSQAIARGTGQAADWLRYSAPMRLGAQLFHRPAFEGTTEAWQRGGEALTEKLSIARADARGLADEVASRLHAEGNLTKPELRAITEGVMQGPMPPQSQEAVDLMRQSQEAAYERRLDLGRESAHLIRTGGEKEMEHYTFRQIEPLAKTSKGYGQVEHFPAHDVATMHREEMLKNVVGGTELGINQMVRDIGPQITGFGLPEGAETITKAAAADQIREKYLRWYPADQAQMEELATRLAGDYADPVARLADEGTYKALKATYDQGDDLASWIPKLDPQRITGQAPVFGNVADNFYKGITRSKAVAAFDEHTHDLLSANATLGQKAFSDVKLTDALNELKLTHNELAEDGSLVRGAMKQQMDRLTPLGKAGDPSDLEKLYIPKELVDDMKRSSEMFANTKTANTLVRGLDSFTNLFKAMVYPFWPAARVRDFETGVFMNLATGTTNPLRWQQAKDILDGKVLRKFSDHPLFKDMSEEEAKRAADKMVFQYNLTGRGASHAGEVTGAAGEVMPSSMIRDMPGITPQNLPAAFAPLKTLDPKAWNPLNVAGFGRTAEDVFAPTLAGKRVASYSDSINRIASWLDQTAKGVEPRLAGAKANAIHIDYEALTDIEKRYMRRLVPFYSWTRRMAPVVMETLAERPGGLMGKSILAAEKMRDPNAPPQVQRGIAIPLGGAKEGQQRYLSALDLPQESILNLFQGGPTAYGTLKNTIQQFGAQLNPALKLPIELGTGTQLFSGRRLEDLYGPMRRLGFETNPILEQLMFNSPLARFFSTGMMVADPRKYNIGLPLNLLTGQRVTDVDLDRARTEMLRNVIEARLEPSPSVRHFNRVFSPKDLKPNLTPEQAAMLQLYNQTLQTRQATP